MKSLLTLLAAAFLFVAPVSVASADDVDRSDPVATAGAFLKVYKAKDPAAMAPLMVEEAQGFLAEIAEQGESHKGWNRVFGGWRMTAAEGWDGDLSEARFRDGMAVVKFAEMEGDEVAVIMLKKEGDTWGVEDINSPSPADFEKLPKTPE